MKTLTRDDTHHGQEYVLKSEADAEIARARAGALEEAVKCVESVTPSEPNCVWAAAYKHVADEHAAKIRALAEGVR
jgi:hypothetical protein